MKIRLLFSEAKFEYDIYHLVQAFYPEADLSFGYTEETQDVPDADLQLDILYGGADVTVRIREGAKCVPETMYLHLTAPDDRAESKNQLKRLVYSGLVRRTGRTLPWGDLSGIRPVKLVTGLLETGLAPEAAAEAMRTRYCVSEDKAELAVQVALREQSLLRAFSYRSGYSLYIDIPFCPSICLYCTFGSHPIGAWQEAVEPYLEALGRELEFIAQLMRDVRLDTIYIGGGTPTAITPAQLDALLRRIEVLFPLAEVREFTVEAGRPDTISREMLAMLRSHPVTRISINPQTMNRRTLELIGRHHTVEQTAEAFQLAREAGFDHINMDMIVGLPGEGAEETAQTLAGIEQLGPDDFTVHSLALKRAARLNLFRDTWRPVSFENSAAIMDYIAAGAARMEMQPYYLYRQKNMAGNFENVGYARAGRACLYNILIMEEKQTVLGAGCGASTKRIRPDGTKAGRTENVKSLRDYIDRTDEMLERKRRLFCAIRAKNHEASQSSEEYTNHKENRTSWQ